MQHKDLHLRCSGDNSFTDQGPGMLNNLSNFKIGCNDLSNKAARPKSHATYALFPLSKVKVCLLALVHPNCKRALDEQ